MSALGTMLGSFLRADTYATLTGFITDPSGRDVPGAVVTLTQLNTNVTYRTESNEKGIYRISTLPPGIYRATVSKEGFKAITKSEIELHVQDVVSVNFALQLGSVVESVTVEAGVALVNTQSGTLSQVVERRYISRNTSLSAMNEDRSIGSLKSKRTPSYRPTDAIFRP